MKKYLSFLLIFIIFIVVSCSSNNENKPAPTPPEPPLQNIKYKILDVEGNELWSDRESSIYFSKFAELLQIVNSKGEGSRKLIVTFLEGDNITLTSDYNLPLSEIYSRDFDESVRALIEGFQGELVLEGGRQIIFDNLIDFLNMKGLAINGSLLVENGSKNVEIGSVNKIKQENGMVHINQSRLYSLNISEVILNNGELYLYGDEEHDVAINNFNFHGGKFDALVDINSAKIDNLSVAGNYFQAHSDLVILNANILEGGVLYVGDQESIEKVNVNAGGVLRVDFGKVFEARLRENGIIDMVGAYQKGDVKYYDEGGKVEGKHADYAQKIAPSYTVKDGAGRILLSQEGDFITFNQFLSLLNALKGASPEDKKLIFSLTNTYSLTLGTDNKTLTSEFYDNIDEDNRTLIEEFDGPFIFEEGKKFIFDETIDRLYMEKLIIEGHLVVIRSGNGEGNEIKIGSLTGLTLNEGNIHIDPREIYGINIQELILNGGKISLYRIYGDFNYEVQSCIYNGGIFDTVPLYYDVIIKNIIINGKLDIDAYFKFDNVTIKNGGELIFYDYINKLIIENGGKFNMNGGRVTEAWLKKGGVASINSGIERWGFRYHDEGGILTGEYAYLAEKIED